VVRSYSIEIEHNCPQCGAPVSLQEAQRIFQCKYCRVRLYITARNHFHYYLPPSTERSVELLFVPYWRFKGIMFHFRTDRTIGRIVDNSTLAVDTRVFPLSLGVRTQTVRLRYLDSQVINHRFLKHLDFKEIFQQLEGIAEGTPPLSPGGYVSRKEGLSLFRAFIGEVKSLIYLPVYERDSIFYDSVAGEPLLRMPEEIQLPREEVPARWQTGFIPTLCPSCGWDLEGATDSLVLVCRNCDTLWKAAGSELKALQYRTMKSSSTGKSVHIPFWVIQGNVTGVGLQTYADLVRHANLPRVIQKQWEEMACSFWVPAFKIHPQHLLKTALTATVNQKETIDMPGIPSTTIYPVTLPSTEAIELARILIMELAKPRKKIYQLIPEISIKDESVTLVLVPFYERAFELSQPEMHISINKRVLFYGRNL